MQFHEIINAKYSNEPDKALMQKDIFPVNAVFAAYLQKFGRDVELPIAYSQLVNYSHADSLKDKKGKWTHWENAVYEPLQLKFLKSSLIKTYVILKSYSVPVVDNQFDIERIDFCEYGNSIPFRIKIIDTLTGRQDFFYIKVADASRIYGLELEHLLTQNPVNFLYHQNTLVEEHIEGIPGDIFLQNKKHSLTSADKSGIANAFVQFNESCFARLLGDMRSYNFVVNIDSSNGQLYYHIRAIDFDQQCYEGKRNFYFPQFYKENIEYVELVLQNLSAREIEQNQQVEFTRMAAGIVERRWQLMQLLNSMVKDDLSENFKIQLLKNELNLYFNTTNFSPCKTMGAIVKQQLKQVLQNHLKIQSLK